MMYSIYLFFQDLVPMDTQIQLGNSREQLRNLANGLAQMKQVVDQMAVRSLGMSIIFSFPQCTIPGLGLCV